MHMWYFRFGETQVEVWRFGQANMTSHGDGSAADRNRGQGQSAVVEGQSTDDGRGR